MRIDAHQHFWKFNPVRDAWITEKMSVIRKDFLPTDLEPLLIQNNIDGCIAVQADQSEQETEFLLQQATRHSFIKGVVGWVDFRSKNITERLSWFSHFKIVKGFRHIVQAEPNGFLEDETFLNGIKKLDKHSFTYDILIYPHQLKEAFDFVQKFPNQKFVIDHLAKPCIKKGEIDDWKKNIFPFRSLENVSCKISGMVTEADWGNWKAKDFIPYLDVILECLGTKRLIYGSDWPVCLLAATYELQLHIVEDYISQLSDSEKNNIMGENARVFYNL
jgi:L-fuconolactonase